MDFSDFGIESLRNLITSTAARKSRSPRPAPDGYGFRPSSGDSSPTYRQGPSGSGLASSHEANLVTRPFLQIAESGEPSQSPDQSQ